MSGVTYTKLNSGNWGLRIVGSSPNVGDSVEVRKKDGSTKTETISRILWRGGDNGKVTVLAAIEQVQRSYKGRGAGRASRECPMCGSRTCPRAYDPHDLCDED